MIEAVIAVVVGLLALLAWEFVGTILMELVSPLVRPFRMLVRPPLGRAFLVLVWTTAALVLGLALRWDDALLGWIGFAVAASGVVLLVVVRDGYREAEGLPPVKTRFPKVLSLPKRIGAAVVALTSAATGWGMLTSPGPGAPETWLTLGGTLLLAIFFGGAALTGRFSAAAVSFFDAEVEGSDEQRSSGA